MTFCPLTKNEFKWYNNAIKNSLYLLKKTHTHKNSGYDKCKAIHDQADELHLTDRQETKKLIKYGKKNVEEYVTSQ